MKNPVVLAFGASSSKNSINKKLANYAAKSVNNSRVKLLDLNDFEMPIYSIDKEKENGFPKEAIQFKKHIKDSDAIVISFAEHNGAYSAAFKNVFDWISRIDKNVWEDKPMFLLATSPGGRGGSSVLEIAFNKFKRMNSNTVVSFSLPSFNANFSEEEGIINEEISKGFSEQLNLFESSLPNK